MRICSCPSSSESFSLEVEAPPAWAAREVIADPSLVLSESQWSCWKIGKVDFSMALYYMSLMWRKNFHHQQYHHHHHHDLWHLVGFRKCLPTNPNPPTPVHMLLISNPQPILLLMCNCFNLYSHTRKCLLFSSVHYISILNPSLQALMFGL